MKAWLSTISITGKANFDRAIEHLLPLPQQDWHKPHPASNIGDNIYVIRFRDENRKQHRVFGHAYHADYSFVMTLDGFEKDDEYHPDDYDATAAKNRDNCKSDHSARTIRCRYAAEACGDDVSNENDFHIECRRCLTTDNE